MDFDDFYWHDAVINRIEIDRKNVGISDTILIEITWPDTTTNEIIFEDVYWLGMNMNFGIIAEESIRTAFICAETDSDLIALYLKWKGRLDDQKLNCYFIETNSTASEIKIISKGFKISV